MGEEIRARSEGHAPFAARERSSDGTGVRIAYSERGSGPAVVLLHGFPDTRASFDEQAPALIDAGYRVITPDLRGYGASDRPSSGYDLDSLSADIEALIESLDEGPIRLVGHDWGGAIAWQLLARRPSLVLRAVILNAPHPLIMARALESNREQLRRSWYFFFFQLPMIAEWWLTKDDAANVARMFREGSPGEQDAPRAIVEAARRSFGTKSAARTAIAYYRAAVRGGLSPAVRRALRETHLQPIDVPVTVIWGTSDSCLGVELLDGLERHVRSLTVHRVERAGHFVHQERASEVNPLLLRALA